MKMPVATLTLEWNSKPPYPGISYQPGWCVKICGRLISSVEVLSSHKFVLTNTGPYRAQCTTSMPSSMEKVGTGPPGWIITPTQEPLFAKDNGAQSDELPMAQVAEYLELMETYGYKIVGSHSIVQSTDTVLVWTLQTL